MAGWRAAGFFLPVRVLSTIFRRLFLQRPQTTFDAGELRFSGNLGELAQPTAFAQRIVQARKIPWVVYAKLPLGGLEQVFAYLGRYTHRVASSNSRLLRLEGNRVSFRWKDYRHHEKAKVMFLEVFEFIRRVLLHTLPDGFDRIRHYGFLANGHGTAKLALCCPRLAVVPLANTTDREPEQRQIARSSQPFFPCSSYGGVMAIRDALPAQ